MGCGNCGSGANGKPAGCKSNGGCSSGGCNKMNVFDWLGIIPLPGGAKPFPIVEVSFNSGSRKEYFKNNASFSLIKGQWVTVEGVGGFDMGEISLTGELVKLQLKKYGIQDKNALKRIMRPSTPEDLELYNTNKQCEQEIMVRSRAIAKELKVDMKIGEVELQADGKKATFFYTAEHRVDFRELIKVFATDFKIKVEMRQIGARQESGKVGGIGSCGRELCCSTWLTDFKSVNTTAARYQSLSINQTKLSGQCGRLKCCLNYELDTYMDALRLFPNNADHIQTAQGKASLIKKDIFRNLMWYSFSSSSKQYPLTIERVTEILAQNKEGIFPEELQAVELESSSKEKLKIDVGFVNDVGQITLKNLEKKKAKHKKKSNKSAAASGQKPNAAATGQKADTPRPQNTSAQKSNAPAPQAKNNPPKPASNRPNNRNKKPKPSKDAKSNAGTPPPPTA
ncbi:MAG: regulatory iron-sulfur-containing complex subunit RicT [Phycisphaerales bacterium]|nr:regulatory iron-sulfur-containing complex subunit RicT [Phycisphaerales bacterium]